MPDARTLLPFHERLRLLKCEALLRLGALGEPGPFGGHDLVRNAEHYRRLGVKLARAHLDGYQRPKLDTAKCPKCRSRLRIEVVSEVSGLRFADTGDSETSYRFASGLLECPVRPEHLSALPRAARTVFLDGTVADLLPEVARLADARGF